ncbi:MAG: guanylate kinase [Eubacteriales bacterium]|nr:guanylate kinase [Eubacteriales bacterium]
MNKGLLIVISGFSGAGKSVITKKLLREYEHYAYSVSATTRNPRAGEVDGKDYFFITKEEFERKIENGELLEHNNYVGNYYGTLKSYVEDKLAEGKDVILEIDVNGGRQVKASYPDTISIFVTAPNASEQSQRLRGRGTESEDVIRARLTKVIDEIPTALTYDYIVVNDDLEKTTERINRIIQDQHLRSCNQKAFLEEFEKDIKTILDK